MPGLEMAIKFCSWCKQEHEFCDCCGIGIGLKHREERFSEKVGDYIVCLLCYSKLLLSGRREIAQGNPHRIIYLKRDGTTKEVTNEISDRK